jgi:nitroreductase
MDIGTIIRHRRSIRNYKKDPVPEEVLLEMLEAARLAPSAANRQPWHFILVSDGRLRKKLRRAYDREWFAAAPHILVGCADPKEAWVRPDGVEYWMVDTAIAICQVTLVCTGSGLGTCWVANFNEDSVRDTLNIPEPIRVVAMTPVGYPAESKGAIEERKGRDEILHRDTW